MERLPQHAASDEQRLGPQASVERIPWKLLLSKPAVWALIISHFCHNWGTFILLTLDAQLLQPGAAAWLQLLVAADLQKGDHLEPAAASAQHAEPGRPCARHLHTRCVRRRCVRGAGTTHAQVDTCLLLPWITMATASSAADCRLRHRSSAVRVSCAREQCAACAGSGSGPAQVGGLLGAALDHHGHRLQCGWPAG